MSVTPAFLLRSREEMLRLGLGSDALLPLEPFTAPGTGLEAALSSRYWERRGPDAFFTGEVPYLSINDGRLSRDAAELFMAGQAARSARPLRVLELGSGSGLFAKFFLDHLREHAPSLYRRTTYVATDGAASMLRHVEESPLFAAHRGRLRAEALHLPPPVHPPGGSGTGLDLVVANYLLDVLPAEWLHLSGRRLHRLRVRACIPRTLDTRLEFGVGPEDLRRLLERGELDDPRLSELQTHIVMDSRYEPVRREDLPFAETIPTSRREVPSGWWPHNHAALACLDRARGWLRPGGAVLVQDYGMHPSRGGLAFQGFQLFGGSLSIGVNFDQLRRWAAGQRDVHWRHPRSDSKQVTSRLLVRGRNPALESAFSKLFHGPRRDEAVDLLEQAQLCIAKEDFESARNRFRQALRVAPGCWHVVERFAAFLIYQRGDPVAGRAMAEAGLALHPASSSLWNDRGDAWFLEGRHDLAEQDFQEALRHHPGDVRSRFNIALTCAARGRDDEALRWLGEALSADRRGVYREALLEKQSALLARREGRLQGAMRRVANRYWNAAVPPE